MNPEELRAKFPLILHWIQQTLSAHAARARPVASLNFPRLRSYFTPATLSAARVVAVDTVPLPPLTALGLTGFTDFENTDAIGITYLDTFFVQADYQDDESLHFHELVHIVQWNLLGPERFLAIYAEGLEQFGYRDSPEQVVGRWVYQTQLLVVNRRFSVGLGGSQNSETQMLN